MTSAHQSLHPAQAAQTELVQLALYKARGRIGNRLIRWWTRSQYSHCELILNGIAYSSSLQDGGVRNKHIDFDPDHWDILPLPWVNAARLRAHYQDTAGQPYGWPDLIWRQILNRAGNSKGWFCSEWCAAVIGLPNPQIYSPATLGEFCAEVLRTWRGKAEQGTGGHTAPAADFSARPH